MAPRSRRTRRRRDPVPDSAALRALGERLRAARHGAGMSQTQLGRPHFTRAYVSAVELGKIRPSVRSLEFLAHQLGRSASAFLDDEADRGREFARLRADEAQARRARPEPLSRADAIGLANAPSDLDALADREVAAAEARHRAGDPAGGVELMRAALTLRRAARELARAEAARRMLARDAAPRPSPRS